MTNGADVALVTDLLELGDALCVLDSEFRIIRVNAAQERITGIPRSQSLGKSHWELFPDSARPDSPLWIEYHRCQRERVSATFEVYYEPLDLWSHVTVHPTSQGGIAIFFRDLSAQRRSERQRQLALDAAHMGWWSYDPQTRVATFDRRYKDIYGVTGDRDTIEELGKLLHPDDLPTALAAVQAALDPVNPRPYRAEYRVNRPDGQQRWVEAHEPGTFEGPRGSRRATLLVGMWTSPSASQAGCARCGRARYARTRRPAQRDAEQALEDAQGRGAPAAGAEDGSGRAPRRGCRARLQQPAHRHPRQRRACAQLSQANRCTRRRTEI